MFLGPTNVRIYNSQERLDSGRYSGAWALVDSNFREPTPRDEVASSESKFFVIQASSPQPSRWKEWSKQRNAPLAVMKAWTWEELYIGGSVDTFFLGTRALTEPPSKRHRLRAVFC